MRDYMPSRSNRSLRRGLIVFLKTIGWKSKPHPAFVLDVKLEKLWLAPLTSYKRSKPTALFDYLLRRDPFNQLRNDSIVRVSESFTASIDSIDKVLGQAEDSDARAIRYQARLCGLDLKIDLCL
jgi:hypothetical protein